MALVYFCSKCERKHTENNKNYSNHREFMDFDYKEPIKIYTPKPKKIREKKKGYREIYENFYETILTSEDIIHHIDLDNSNNNPSNLFKTDKKQHRKLHILLDKLGRRLIKKAIKNEFLYFDNLTQKYYLKNDFKIIRENNYI